MGVSYIRDRPHKKKSRHERSGERGGQATASPHPNHRFRNVIQIVSYVSYIMGWCSILLEPHYQSDVWGTSFNMSGSTCCSNVRIAAKVQVGSLEPPPYSPDLAPNLCSKHVFGTRFSSESDVKTVVEN
ncbi:hypothetical protein AVEN_134972-1 [Araneus ventricosus]|uniref:Uncharacterized protein n=1 Tax=Araneus ventricosus TaxID=182803 RepID=A0A4Y2CHE6_ARAVE|nr:hypothetical protein AVEN_134972-1 [Araneus ventricosus]